MREVFGFDVGLWDSIRGFAVDPVTLEWLVTEGCGSHRVAKIYLSSRIDKIESYRHPWQSFPSDESHREFRRDCEQRIIEGLILNKVEGFVTPILMLDNCEYVPPEHLNKIAAYLLRQKQFIPVDSSGQLIVG